MMNYQFSLSVVEQESPNHPLLDVLRQGESPMNRLYLQQIVNALLVVPKKKDTKSNPKPYTGLSQGISAETAYKGLKTLRIEKSKIRNHYFSCTSDDQRASINQRLIKMRADINILVKKIAYYKSTGLFPKIQESSSTFSELPTDVLDLKNLLLNTRSNISKNKSKLKKAYTSNLAATKIEGLEKKQADLLKKRQAIEQKIENTCKVT